MAFKKKSSSEGRGIILFERVEEALKAERLLREAGYACKLIAPPPALRRGCDLALEINLVEQMGIERLLKERDVNYLEITSLKGRATELSGIVKVIDFGEAVMVKAANMKLTFDKKTGDPNVDIGREQHVTTSQIRQIFGKLKSIEAKGYDNDETRTEFIMLKPLLAYAAGRHDKIGIEIGRASCRERV